MRARESDKSHIRRIKNGDYETYFVGLGLDFGYGWGTPVVPNAMGWEHNDGDVQRHFAPGFFDFIHSSHCLEHIPDPKEMMKIWWTLIKAGGHLIVTVPDWINYEQRIETLPSRYNPDHKHFFSMRQIPIFLEECALPNVQVRRIQLNDAGFDYSERDTDQTQRFAQAEIEIILRKMKPEHEFYANY